MANELIKAVSQNKVIYKEFRTFIYMKFNKSKEKVLKLESSNMSACIPYLIMFIENKNIAFNEVIIFYSYERTNLPYWDLLKISIVGAFRKLEQNDFNFIPF